MRRAEVLALAILQGPAELLPISSSGHLEGVPLLLGWQHAKLGGEQRKEVEVALHAGAAVALAAGLRRELAAADPVVIAASLAPPVALGLAAERVIEQRLGGHGSLAAGLVAGSVALVLADRAPRRRRLEEATWRDGLALGLAQACALMPGVSRTAATLSAARARGFAPADAARLSRTAGVPVLVGAGALKGLRLARRGASRDAATLAAGAIVAGAATWVSLPLARVLERPLAPWAAYRTALAGALLAHRRGVRKNGAR